MRFDSGNRHNVQEAVRPFNQVERIQTDTGDESNQIQEIAAEAFAVEFET